MQKELNRPTGRLHPRTGMRSGLLECYRLKYDSSVYNNDQTSQEKSNFFVADVNGLYAYIGLTCSFPVGKPIIIIGNDLKFVKTENCSLTFKDIPLQNGMIYCSILAPQECSIPFLQYRYKNENYLALCRGCIKSKKAKCRHKVKAKQFTSVWTIPDINYALTIGYEILDVFEIHYFAEQKPLLKDFVKYLTSERLKNSLQNFCPETFCNMVNSALELPPKFHLTPSNVTDNNSKRNMYKIETNALFGKFSQNADLTCNDIVHSQNNWKIFLNLLKLLVLPL